MRSRLSGAALVLSLIGLGASIASLVDYFAAEPAFCAESGCATVRASAWSHPLGIPMPLAGVAFFATMTVLAFANARRVRVVLALAGSAWALFLVGLQAFSIGAWCKLCMIADPAAIALAIVVVAGAQPVRFTWLRALLALPAVAALPLAIALVTVRAPAAAAADVPAFVAHAQVPGVVTIVELVDFECPFCRKLAPKLATAVAQAHEHVAVVRKMVPLPQHHHARDAALAWCCADAQGKGDAMAEALFAAPADTLTPDGCEQLAVSVGCDRDRYRTALADPATAARVDRDTAEAKAAGIHHFPTVFVGEHMIHGSDHEPAELLALIDHVAAR